MDRIVVTRPVAVKVRVTDGFKKSYAAQVEYSVRRLDAEIKRLEVQEKKLSMSAQTDGPNLEQIRSERKKRLESREQLLEQARKVLSLAPGAEVLQGRVESIVEVGVGDDWHRVMGVEIIIEDGLVAEIRPDGRRENSSE